MVLKRKKLESSFQQNWFMMLYHLHAFANGRDQEDLHKWRVEVKKIRARAWLMQKCLHEDKKSFSLDELKEMFKEAGKIREIYVHQNLHGTDSPDKIKKPGDAFVKKIAARSAAMGRVHTAFIQAMDEIPFKKIDRFFENELKKANTLLQDEKQWHLARKKIKRLVYVESFLPGKMQKAIGINIKYLKKLEEELGSWHDLHIVKSASKDVKGTALSQLQAKIQKAKTGIQNAAGDFAKKSH